MALYLGSDKRKIILDSVVYRFNLFTEAPITNSIRLLSSDNYILKDSNGLYLTVMNSIRLLSLDGCSLKDLNGLYITAKEDEIIMEAEYKLSYTAAEIDEKLEKVVDGAFVITDADKTAIAEECATLIDVSLEAAIGNGVIV